MGAAFAPFFFRRRINLCDPAKAIGLGIVRSGDKRSAHFCAVPAGYDAKPKRLFCLNVTRRTILHEVNAFKLEFDLLSSAERFPAVRRTTIRSVFVGERSKVCKYGREQIAMTGVGRSRPRGVQIQKVAHLGGRLRPRSSWNRQELVVPLPIAQFPRVVLDVCQSTPRFLRCHAAVPVEIERLVTQATRSRQRAARRRERSS